MTMKTSICSVRLSQIHSPKERLLVGHLGPLPTSGAAVQEQDLGLSAMLTAGILLARHQNHHGKLIADVGPFRGLDVAVFHVRDSAETVFASSADAGCR